MTPLLAAAAALAAASDLGAGAHRKVRRRALRTRLGVPDPTAPDPRACDRTIPSGTRLFHGTSEPYAAVALRPGGDGFVWLVSTPDVAQTYVPVAGLEVLTSAGRLIRPSRDREIRAVQAAIGLVWDLDAVTWDATGRPDSWPRPRGEADFPDEDEVVRRLRALGYAVADRHAPIWFRFHRGRLLGPDERAPGRLLVLRTRAPLHLSDHAARAGEGDLLEPAYTQLDTLHAARAAGCDGVRIHDFCQTRSRGNVGHVAIGLFAGALPKLSLEATIPARHYEWTSRDDVYRATTPEWDAWTAAHGEGWPTNLAEIVEAGVRFATAIPVTFPFVRNPEKAPRMDPAVLDVGRAIEPAGRYLLHRGALSGVPPGWEEGVVTFRRPIVLEHGATSSRPEGWKARVSAAFGGRRGIWLSRALRRAGIDGIVTVDVTHDETSEIVDLTGIAPA